MPRIIESLSAINSLIRTGLAMLAVGVIGAGGYYGYRAYNATDLAMQEKVQELERMRNQLAEKQGVLEEQKRQLAAQEKEIQKLDTALRLLKVDHRVAWLTVLEQEEDPETGELYTTGQFVEVNDQGEMLGEPRLFRIKGDLVYIEYWVVKFKDKYVEQAEIERSTSLVLFRRIFGESQAPGDGMMLDKVGSRPRAYGDGEQVSAFEKKIWNEFWTIANDEEKAEEMGIRAAHGEAPSMKLKKGQSYRILLRASDGLSIIPDSRPPPIADKPAA
ncbi:MAG: hypothetical protein ACQESR_07455 [Planctomycetota bacterium]